MKTVNLLRHIYTSAHDRGESRGVHFLRYGSDDAVVSYEKLLGMSAWLGQKVPEKSQDRPHVVVIAAMDPLPTLMAFFAALGCGSLPLILPGPQLAGGLDEFVGRIERVIAWFPGHCVLALQEDLVIGNVRLPDVPVIPVPAEPAGYGLEAGWPLGAQPTTGGDEIAFLQMTSASTGDSKLVAISHANACANLTALHEALDATPDERIVSWLPLYHDMGLVGTTMFSFFHGYQLAMMRPSDFIMRPHRWIGALSRYRCTITAAPNFGYDYAERMVADKDIEGCDLAALKAAIIGAEPIRLATMQRFAQRFHQHGFRASSLTCAFGMAESTLASTMAIPGTKPRYLLVDPGQTDSGEPVRILGTGSMDDEGHLDSAPPAGLRGVAVFSAGSAVRGVEVGLVDDAGQPLSQVHTLGEIVLDGPSVSVGYLDPATVSPVPFPDGVLRTGDLGFLDNGDLFIVERKKNVIIRQGKNFLASLIEEQVARVLDRPADELIVFDADIHDPDSAISVIVENFTQRADIDDGQIAALRGLDLPVDVLLIARKRVIPRTTSGKKKHYEARRKAAEGTLKIDRVVHLRATES
jgi:acyl-CoA synthetase (AMP-forming)/AMP-acid ligase II